MTFEFAAFLLALTNVLSFLLWAWGALFVLWGAAKAARRMFWTEAEPWKGPQLPKLEEIRTTFGHRILLALEFFVAGDILRLMVDASLDDLLRIGLLVAIRVVLGFFITREIRLPTITVRGRPVTRVRVSS